MSDIVRHATEAQEYLSASTKEVFRQNRKEQDSVNYKIIVIGEAANRLSKTFQAEHPAIPWSRIIGMRNVVAHQYGHIDPDIVWDAVKTKLPVLVSYLTPFLKGPGDDGPGNLGSIAPGTGRTRQIGAERSNDQKKDPSGKQSREPRKPVSRTSDEWER